MQLAGLLSSYFAPGKQRRGLCISSSEAGVDEAKQRRRKMRDATTRKDVRDATTARRGAPALPEYIFLVPGDIESNESWS